MLVAGNKCDLTDDAAVEAFAKEMAARGCEFLDVYKRQKYRKTVDKRAPA